MKSLVLGGTGLVGSAIVRELNRQNCGEILNPPRRELNLLNQKNVDDYFKTHKPDRVYLAAAKVGGILANSTYQADFIFENLTIQNNVFKAAFEANVEKLLFLGSSCIYPRKCPQPIKEEYLLTGPLEPTNEPYAVAKIAGLKTAEYFRKQYGKKFYSVMPTNIYGENDNFHPENSHVIPGLIVRMYKTIQEKKSEFIVWGTGHPLREFLYVDDLARACVHILNLNQENIPDLINVGTGEDISIRGLVEILAKKMGFTGKLAFDHTKPDGMMRKCLDITRVKSLGWEPAIDLDQGLDLILNFFYQNVAGKK